MLNHGPLGDTLLKYLLAQLMQRLENTGRPLGDANFLKEIGQLLSRDFMPQKRGPKGPWKKKKPII
jgi:hypothetical protein